MEGVLDEHDDTADPAPKAKPKVDKPLPNPLMPNFWAVLAMIAVVIANALAWFIQRWLIDVRAALQFSSASALKEGTYAHITPHPHQVSTGGHCWFAPGLR